MTAQHFNKKVVQLEQLRVVANLTQVQLATICGFSAASNWSRLVAAAFSGSAMRPRIETRQRVDVGVYILKIELKNKQLIPLKIVKNDLSIKTKINGLKYAFSRYY